MLQINTILVPVDFSGASKKAARYGLTLAFQFNARLLLAHVVQDASALTYAVPPEGIAARQVQADLADREIRGLMPAEVAQRVEVSTVVRIGDVERELLDLVDSEHAGLVVMGTQGRTRLGRWLLGSVTERMLRKLPVPVLTVSHLEQDDELIDMRPVDLKHFLYATDLSDESRAGYTFAVEFARAAGARMTALHVVDELEMVYWGGAAQQHWDQKKLITEMEAKLRDFVLCDEHTGVDIETLVLEGKPYRKILQVAVERGADMIVLNLQSKDFLERAFLGATAERVIRLAKVPVLGVPAAGANEAST